MVFFYCLANYLHGLSHGVLWLECLDLEWDGLNVCSHQHELLDVAPGPHQVLRHNLHSVHLAFIQPKRRVQSWDAQDIRPRNPANFISGRIPDMIAGHWVLKPGDQAKIKQIRNFLLGIFIVVNRKWLIGKCTHVPYVFSQKTFSFSWIKVLK